MNEQLFQISEYHFNKGGSASEITGQIFFNFMGFLEIGPNIRIAVGTLPRYLVPIWGTSNPSLNFNN